MFAFHIHINNQASLDLKETEVSGPDAKASPIEHDEDVQVLPDGVAII